MSPPPSVVSIESLARIASPRDRRGYFVVEVVVAGAVDSGALVAGAVVGVTAAVVDGAGAVVDVGGDAGAARA